MLKLRYIRQSIRESYEKYLVEVLVAYGYDITLSTDLDDEILGIDAWITDPKTGARLPLDFFEGCDRSSGLAPKLAKAEIRGILVLHIPDTLIVTSKPLHTESGLQARNQIKAITQRTLLQARFRKLMTEEEAKRQRLASLKEMYYSNSRRVQQVA